MLPELLLANLYFSKWHFSKMSGRDFIGVRVLFFQKNVGFKYGRTTHKEFLEETLTKRNYMDVKTGVKHFTNPGNHENPCFLYFVKTLFN